MHRLAAQRGQVDSPRWGVWARPIFLVRCQEFECRRGWTDSGWQSAGLRRTSATVRRNLMRSGRLGKRVCRERLIVPGLVRLGSWLRAGSRRWPLRRERGHDAQGACGLGFDAGRESDGDADGARAKVQFAPSDGVTVLAGHVDAAGMCSQGAALPAPTRSRFRRYSRVTVKGTACAACSRPRAAGRPWRCGGAEIGRWGRGGVDGPTLGARPLGSGKAGRGRSRVLLSVAGWTSARLSQERRGRRRG